MGLTRAAQSPATVQRSFKVTRLHRTYPTQSRTLWWWARKSRRCFGEEHEDIEERLRRHQALMFHRYSKAIKRRSLWDRDEPSYHASWRARIFQAERDLSSTSSAQAKVEERNTKDSGQRDAWREYHSNFESFKRAVDRAIARDPYGTLFGRRLRSPESPNNSSWTSWSWIFDPKEIKEEPKLEPEKNSVSTEPKKEKPASQPVAANTSDTATSAPSSSQPTLAHSSSSSRTSTTLKASQSFVFSDRTSTVTEYVYDPISGRKIPQQPEPQACSPPKSLSTPVPRELSASKRTTDISHKPESKTFLQAMFGENGVSVQVKTYKPPKVYGYTGERKSEDSTSKAPPIVGKRHGPSPENSKKREYDQLRLRTLGNNIDATNFNCEPWNNIQPEPSKNENVEVSAEKRLRTPTAPSEDAALFSGTTYEFKSDKIIPNPKSDWLAQEGFRSKQGMTIPSLRDHSTTTEETQPAAKMEAAVDRADRNGVNIPVKTYTSKLQPSLDRVVVPNVSKATPEISAFPKSTLTKYTEPTPQEKHEDIDLLRASDVRAAAKAARITRQEVESRKKQERQTLEKDFDARQNDSHGLGGLNSNPKLNQVWQHIKDHPSGVVARTLQTLGISGVSGEETRTDPFTPPPPPPISNATIKVTDDSGKQLESLASELNEIYREHRPEEADKGFDVLVGKNQTVGKAFSEPTVKPGVVRNLEIERHTQEFEPKIAAIVDKAKQVKRELHGVSQSVDDVAKPHSAIAITDKNLPTRDAKPVTTRAEKVTENSPPTTKSVQPQSVTQPITFDTQFVLLMYNRELGDVFATPLNNLMGEHVSQTNQNPMAAIGSLKNPSAFVRHFVDLDKNGYELKSGGREILIFQKKSVAKDISEDISSHSTSRLRRDIAAAEASAQPENQPLRRTANVLDELPTVVPTPGPSAPTAPTLPRRPQDPFSQNDSNRPAGSQSSQEAPSATSRRSSARVTRQEQVFSGQVRLPPHITGLPDPEHFQKQNPVSDPRAEAEQTPPEPGLGFFARLRRGIRRVVLTSLAFGVGAYGIGVIAEAINAKAQIASSDAGGPMKKLVLDTSRTQSDRQRAGIFSTESSRE